MQPPGGSTTFGLNGRFHPPSRLKERGLSRYTLPQDDRQLQTVEAFLTAIVYAPQGEKYRDSKSLPQVPVIRYQLFVISYQTDQTNQINQKMLRYRCRGISITTTIINERKQINLSKQL
jgi:hypothetical protein